MAGYTPSHSNRVELDEDEVPKKCCLSEGGTSALKQNRVFQSMAMVPHGNNRLNDSFYFENALKENYIRFKTIYIPQRIRLINYCSEF